ncbi:hypothetical protein B0T24DRAFT_125378 [Lasiosphaeria ovina]|uniref:4-coumarate:coenzyme A ligase n=1 Tax=Lasiosphaeria ovina TaxID=92902 RepID=A0AAE0JRY6_9PEZI|nr:hypothetical protein B0T24DRAFT_125378 [Lasiosphaeria ovina]
MPIRIPAATKTEVFCFGAAGVGAFAPFYMMVPGAEERIARQTVKWAPRWERNITFFKSPVERSIQKVTPPVARTVQRVDRKLPLENVAKRADSRIKKNFDILGIKRT